MGSEIESLYLELHRSPKSKFRTNILPKIYIASATYQISLNARELDALEKYVGSSCPTEHFWAFNRVELSSSGSIICGLAYKRMHKRNCAAIKYFANNKWGFAMVCFFIKYDLSLNKPLYLAVAHPISCTSFNSKLHINRVTPYKVEEVLVVDVSTISSNCIYIGFKGDNDGCESAYVCEFPNKMECD